MATDTTTVIWEAPEHVHIEKSGDWYWVFGIIGVAAGTASLIFNNVLFGVLLFIATFVIILFSLRTPKIMTFEVSTRGIRAGDRLYPYTTLESFCIDSDHRHGPHLLVKSKHLLMPLIIMPIPEEYVDEIDAIIAPRLHDEHLEEPLSQRILESFGI